MCRFRRAAASTSPRGSPPKSFRKILGQQIAIINQGGGGGAIATDAVVRADPDGYTLLYHSVTGITHAAVTEDLSYDWLRDLAPVSLIARFAPVMIVSPTLPVKTMADFIALLKANPGKYSYGSSGTGTAVHLATELFKQKAGVDIVHVPYRGTVAVLPDLISGRVVMMIDGVPAETKNIQNGVVRALAVTTATRSPSIPDVPTMREVGLDYEVPFWTGLYAPIRTPQAIIDKLAAAANQAMHDAGVIKRLGRHRHRRGRLAARRARCGHPRAVRALSGDRAGQSGAVERAVTALTPSSAPSGRARRWSLRA